MAIAVNASAYPERWQTVPPPVQPLTVVSSNYWPDTLSWNGPNLGGTFEVKNALVSKDHKVGAWSQPFTFTANDGWRVNVGCWNQVPTRNCIGVLWKIQATALNDNQGIPRPLFEAGHQVLHQIAFTGGTMPPCRTTPISSPFPMLKVLYQTYNKFAYEDLRPGGANTVVAPPPIVLVGNIPMVTIRLAWCWVTHKGETALSPVTTIANDPANSSLWCAIEAKIGEGLYGNNQQVPLGALGYHVYIDIDDGDGWKRVPAPHCYGTPAARSDWLFQLDDYRPQIYRMLDDAPAHQAAPQAQSWVDSVSIALNDTVGDVIVDINPVPCYAPMLDQFDVYGTFGSNLKDNRTVTTPTGGRWDYQLQQTFEEGGITYNQHATNFPMLLVQNSRSTFKGMKMTGSPSAFLAFSCYNGGQCFSNRFIDCGGSGGDGTTIVYGARGLLRNFNAGVNEGDGHSVSETEWINCSFNCSIPWAIEHGQSANIRFSHCFATSYGNPDYRCCSIWWNAPVPVTFDGGLFCECPGNVIFSLGLCDKIIIDGIWVDGGCVALFDVLDYITPDVKMINGKLNFWAPDDSTLWLARVYSSNNPVSFRFDNITPAIDHNNTAVLVSNTSYYRTKLMFIETTLSDITVLREPDHEQFAEETIQYTEAEGRTEEFLNPDEPGLKQMAPAFTIGMPSFPYFDERLPQVAVSVPAQVITINSLSGTLQVQRADWWSDDDVVVGTSKRRRKPKHRRA